MRCRSLFKLQKFNTLYPKQYYLHNINGVDINIENAWNIASNLGNNIIVAVIDEGVEHNHEDLPNILDGYTANYANENGNPINATTNSPKAHGTACAGIISAENNTIGIRGIASNAQILPINICPNDYFANDLEIAKAIRWASERADVLSCSWGGNGGSSVSISEALRMLLRMEEMEKVVLLYLLQEMVLHYTTTLLIQLQKRSH